MPAIKLSGKTLPLPAWVNALRDVGISWRVSSGQGLLRCPYNPCWLPLQRDPVDAGQRRAAALPEPQTPKHGEAAEVVQSMEGERQVSVSLLRRWKFRGRAVVHRHALRPLHPSRRRHFISKPTNISGCSMRFLSCHMHSSLLF